MLATIAAMIASAAGAQVPPPPAPVPPELERPVDGYDMRTPYQLWHRWVEARKATIIAELLKDPEQIKGMTHDHLLMRFETYGPYGRSVAGDIRTYCPDPASAAADTPRNSCHHVLRRAYVPFDATSYGYPNPISDWTESHFDAASLARHFRAKGLAPDTNWLLADQSRMFEDAPSPDSILRKNAIILRSNSLECPAMAEAIETTLPKRAIDLPQPESQVPPPMQHSHGWNATFFLLLDGKPRQLQGSHGLVDRLSDPILDAATSCKTTNVKS